jgi:hypothetical protein
MDACVRCGADTVRLEHGAAPLCVVCYDELERELDQSLVASFREAARSYRQDLCDLGAAAGGPDFNAFQNLLKRCERSWLVCIELLGAMERRGLPGGRPRFLE